MLSKFPNYASNCLPTGQAGPTTQPSKDIWNMTGSRCVTHCKWLTLAVFPFSANSNFTPLVALAKTIEVTFAPVSIRRVAAARYVKDLTVSLLLPDAFLPPLQSLNTNKLPFLSSIFPWLSKSSPHITPGFMFEGKTSAQILPLPPPGPPSHTPGMPCHLALLLVLRTYLRRRQTCDLSSGVDPNTFWISEEELLESGESQGTAKEFHEFTIARVVNSILEGGEPKSETNWQASATWAS